MSENLKLFLFSDHRTPADLPLDREVVAATGVTHPTVAWIPSGGSPEKTDRYFADRRARYAEVGVNCVEMFPLHRQAYHLSLPHLLSFDIPDGAGLVVIGNEVRPYGPCVRIEGGKEEELTIE